MGVDFAKAALAAGHAVVATGRDPDRVSKALGTSNDLLAVKLDVTRRADAEAAVRAAVDRFGRIDVLVNNAASFYAGYFEELSPEQMDRQLAASLTGPDERHPRCPAGDAQAALGARHRDLLLGGPRGLRVRHRLRRVEVRPRGVDGVARARGRAVRHRDHHREPGVLPHGAPHGAVDELRRAVHRRTTAERRAKQLEFWRAQNGKQGGDPAKLAQALMTIADQERPPLRFIAGADAIGMAEQAVATLRQQIDAFRGLSSSLAFDEAVTAGSAK